MKSLLGNICRYATLLALVPLGCLVQSCIPLATGVVAYRSAVSEQEHAAYADYLFAAQAHNKTLQREGRPPEGILSKEPWLKDVYRPKLAYADYYLKWTKENVSSNSIMSFESWKEIEYPKILEKQKMRKQEFRRGPKR